jgi:hypothetical protein
VADHVQKIQLVFLAQCADETANALAARRFHEWLVQSGEGAKLVERGRSRRGILEVVAQEQSDAPSAPPDLPRKPPPRRG